MAIKYKWLAEHLREMTISNMKKGIDTLPTESQLCSRYHVSRQTVRKSLSILEQEGLIAKRQGSGSHITGLHKDPSENEIHILIITDEKYLYPVLLSDIKNTLLQYGFSCHVHVTDNRTDLERTILLKLLDKQPRGIIVEGCKSALPNPNLDLYHKLENNGTHILFLHNYYPALSHPLYIKDNNMQGSRLLVKHLYEQGHRKICGFFIADDLQGPERFQGYIDAMKEFQLPIIDGNIGWFRYGDLQRLEKGEHTSFIQKMIRDNLNDCTAILCYNDELAYWTTRELQKMPSIFLDDISVVSFDNSYLSYTDTMPILSLTHQKHKMGITAANMMLDTIKGLPVYSQEIPWMIYDKNH